MPEPRRRPLAWRWLALVAALGVLHICGFGALARPSLSHLSTPGAWAGSRPPVETALAVIRLLALVAGGYLWIIVTIALVASVMGHRPTLSLATRLTPSHFRGVLALASTATITAIITTPLTATAAGAPAPASRPAAPPTLRWAGAFARASTPAAPPTLRWVGPVPGQAADPPALRWVAPSATSPPDAGATTPSTTTLSTTTPATTRPSTTRPSAKRPRSTGSAKMGPPTTLPASPSGPAPVQVPGHRTSSPRPSGPGRPRPVQHRPSRAPWTTDHGSTDHGPTDTGPTDYIVRPGDNFWSIAAARLVAGGVANPPDDGRIASYWRHLIDANRPDLPVPGDPGLLFPGDRIRLPPL